MLQARPMTTEYCLNSDPLNPGNNEFSLPAQPEQGLDVVAHRPDAFPGDASAPLAEAPVAVHELLSDEFQPLDAKNIQVEMISSLIGATVVTVGLLVGTVIAWWNFGFGWIFWTVLASCLVLIVAMYVMSFWWPRLEFRHTHYRIDEQGLDIRRGVLWRHQVTVPLGRVQHADVSQGPLQRSFGVGTLTVHTAGTQNSSVGLEGLEHGLALQLRDLIVHQRGEHDAV